MKNTIERLLKQYEDISLKIDQNLSLAEQDQRSADLHRRSAKAMSDELGAIGRQLFNVVEKECNRLEDQS